MKKILFLVIFAVCLIKTQGQSVDSLIVGRCGTSAGYIKEVHKAFQEYFLKQKDSSYKIPKGIEFVRLQQNFPQDSIVTCGKFKLYYEDFMWSPRVGFCDSQSGQARRNTLCQVLNYIQNTFYIPTGDTLDIYIARSYSANYPASADAGLAQAGPFYPPDFFTTPGVYPGHFFNHVKNGCDPEQNQYDGILQVNFDYFYDNWLNPYVISYWDDTLNITPGDYFDLYSILLHEVGHIMGWCSNVTEDHIDHFAITNGSITLYDSLFLYYGNVTTPSNFEKVISFDNNGLPIINPSLDSINDIFRQNMIWSTNLGIPMNDPIYSGSYFSQTFYPLSALSHIADDEFSFLTMLQYSPGFRPKYVMGPFTSFQETKREYSLNELRYIKSMGYSFTNSFNHSTNINRQDTNSWLVTQNHPPFRTNNSLPVSYMETYCEIYDTIAPLFNIVNHNTKYNTNQSFIIYDLMQDNTLNDIESDSIKIFPGSLYGIRGVGDTLINNHNRLEITDHGTKIKYTPLPGFWGRAQFGFNLWDGHEIGSYKLLTIDVLPDTSTIGKYDELVINGNFEDGMEVRQIIGSKSGFINTTLYDQRRFEEFEFDIFSSGHPFISCGSRCVILNSCYSSHDGFPGNPFIPGYFGFDLHSCDSLDLSSSGNPLPMKTPNNERYEQLINWCNFSSLKRPIEKCNKYKLECDLTFSSDYYSLGDTIELQLFGYNLNKNVMTWTSEFLSTIRISVDSIYTHANLSKWQHVTHYFDFCGADDYYNINIYDYENIGMYIDNISLKALPVELMSVSIVSDTNQIFLGEDVNISAIVFDTVCPVTYSWSTGNYTSQTINVTPDSTTTYYVTISNGCTSIVDSITIEIIPNFTGWVRYKDNESDSPLFPLNSTLVSLYVSGNPEYYEWTDSEGNFLIHCLPETYDVILDIQNSYTVPNSTDALLAVKYTVGQYTLSSFQQHLADVNGNLSINAGDALAILKRFVGQISSFPNGVEDWYSDIYSGSNPITINSNQTYTGNFSAACMGDVDLSNYSAYLIGPKQSPNVRLNTSGSKYVKSGKAFDIDVVINDSMVVGAMSLEFYIPPDIYKLNDVQIPGTCDTCKIIVYNDHTGDLKIAW
ncbi:MAG: hypothetical protein NTU44_14420, partial [Bacteroidetes bacterium]|nr:hypothetical protein [Bacteroidota bacterium]